MIKLFNDPGDELEIPDFPTDNPSPGTTVIDLGLQIIIKNPKIKYKTEMMAIVTKTKLNLSCLFLFLVKMFVCFQA